MVYQKRSDKMKILSAIIFFGAFALLQVLAFGQCIAGLWNF